MIKKLFTTPDGKNHGVTFGLVCSLFLLWGLCNGMIDILDKHFQNTLHVTKAESAFVQGAWFFAYFVMAIPSGWVARKYGYRGGIIAGLVIVIIGCLLFVPITKIEASGFVVFAAFLSALFVVASGLSFLETVANPYTTVLGSPNGAVMRINMAQSCNAFGTALGPILGGSFILSQTGETNTSNASLYIPYLFVAAIVAVLVVVFSLAPVPDLHAPQETRPATSPRQHARSIFQERHFTLGVLAQFLYVGAQLGIFSFFINYIKDDRYMPALPLWIADQLPASMKFLQGSDWHITEYAASLLLSLAFLFFTVGRVTGSIVLRFCSSHLTLAAYALINVVLMILVYLGLGWPSIIALFLSFFFMSIMFPTIFALSIRGLGENTKLGSSFLVQSIVGGAFMPILMGSISDHYNMGVGFFVPLACFLFILIYGLFWKSFFNEDMTPVE